MQDSTTKFSDQWWIRRCFREMYARPQRPVYTISDSRKYEMRRDQWLSLLWAHYTGEAPLSRLADKYADATREFLRLSKNNYPGIVVQAVLDRVKFQGIQSVTEADADGDDDVRRLLAANGAFFADATEYAVAMGTGLVLVGPDGDGGALATAEDPRLMVAVTDPTNSRRIRAAMKRYWDPDDEVSVLALYRTEPDGTGPRVAAFVHDGQSAATAFSPSRWESDPSRSRDLVAGVGLPIVQLQNKHAAGEFEAALPLVERITNDIGDRLWTSKFQTFLQRAILGADELPDNDEDGNPIDYNEIFTADPGALWRIPGKASLWESRQVSINELLAPVRDDIKELSATTRTPLAMFSPDAMTGSAEGASLADSGLVDKATDLQERWGPDVVQIGRLLLAYAGKSANGEWQAMWSAATRESMQQRVQAGAQAKGAGVPTEGVWADVMHMPPATVSRWKKQRDRETLFATSTQQELPGLRTG